jgi:hypothetical protein
MPTALIALSMLTILLSGSRSDAATSCMTKMEARRHFGSVHLYWHGRDYCWDASPKRQQRQIHRVRKRTTQRKWHDAMSEISAETKKPVQIPAAGPWVSRWVDIAPLEVPMLVRRSIDIGPIEVAQTDERHSRSTLPPHLLFLLFIAVAVATMLVIIECLFRRTRFA